MKQSMIIALSLGFFALSGCDQDSGGDFTQPVSPPPQEKFEWKMVTAWPKNFPGLGVAPERLSRLVEEMSGGRFKIKVYAAGEIVPALGVFDAVSEGAVEVGHTGSYYDKGKLPAAQFFTGVPFGLTATELSAWMEYGGGRQLFEELYRPHNILPFPGGNTGPQMAGWFNKNIRTLRDMNGLRMRIPGIAGDVLNQIGATTVTLPGSELYTSMQAGLIDAAEWVGPYNDLAFGLHRVANYYYYPAWHEPGSSLYFGVNIQAWAKLPSDLQAIFQVAAEAVHAGMLHEYTARNQEALSTLRTEHGIALRPLPDDVIEALRKVSKREIDKYGQSRDSLTRRIHASFRAFEKKVRAYSEVSDKAFLNIR